MIARYNNISLALGIPGLIMQVAGNIMASKPEYQTIGPGVALVGTGLLIIGLSFYAMSKGRSGAWGLMGFLSIIGLIVLACLKDNAPRGR